MIEPFYPDKSGNGKGVVDVFNKTDVDRALYYFGLSLFNPEAYGAKGDGKTNDTVAFNSMAQAIAARGGGIIELRPVTYIVGKQTLVNDGTWMYKPSPVLYFNGVTKAIIIRGNGAELKLDDGLKFGTFDANGNATSHAQPYYTRTEVSSPTENGILDFYNCTGVISIENLRLNGNVAKINRGGPWGDTGWQLGGDGILFQNNTGGMYIRNVTSRLFPRDGWLILDSLVPGASEPGKTFIDCIADANCRQGMSFVGGSNYHFQGCSFNRTGVQAATGVSWSSAPGAGVDMEAETAAIRRLYFVGCEFAQNTGANLLAVGDVQDITVDRCRIIGNVNWSMYGFPGPGCVVTDSLIVGSFVAPATLSNPSRVPIFRRCTISDDKSLGGTNQIYLGQGINASGWIPDYGGGANGTIFDDCIWNLVDLGRGPYTDTAVYRNCNIKTGPNVGGVTAFANGSWQGFCTFTGGQISSLFPGNGGGKITYNGVLQQVGSKVYNPPSIANGAETTTTVTVPNSFLGDYVKVSFSLSLQDIKASGYVSADGTVTVIFRNDTGSAVDLASGTLNVEVSR